MAHVVMCWELGGDLGHVARMKPLAEALHRHGHRVSFILRECLPAERLLDPERFRWFQAPYQSEAVPDSRKPTWNMADVLYNTGFHSPRNLAGRMRAWRALFALLDPDLLVFDHSPTALLAAHGLKIPRVILGTGFGIPPAVSPFPAFEADAAVPDLTGSEKQITLSINGALEDMGSAPIARLADIYTAEAKVFFTLRELDHYPARDAGDYWGAPRQDAGIPTAWPGGSGKRVFAYLKPFKTLPALLKTLQESGHPTLIYLSKGAEATRREFQSASNLAFSERPVDLPSAVAKADLVICHSGHGTISAALLGGKPLLLLPLNMEQRMLSARVMQAGAGLAAPALAPEGMQQKFQRLMAEPAFTEAARTFAERYASLKVETIPERFAALAERLIASEVP
jgi:UDP-N-acetylglucosamine:LPS N-acetylglucosamine transferase